MKTYQKIVITLFIGVLYQFILAADTIEQKLLPPANNGIYFGAFPDFGGTENLVTKKAIDDFESLIDSKIVWAPFSQHWVEGLAYPKKNIHLLNDRGLIPYVRFLPRSSFKAFVVEERFSLEKIINGDFDTELHLWAKDAKQDNIPLIMDFALEMNGDWFGWSGDLNGANRKEGYGDKTLFDGPERYRDAYRHIIDIFREEDVHHVTWFFHPNIHSSPKKAWNKPKNYYPGDDYIDWIGISIYGPFHPAENYWDTFEEIIEANYQQIDEISTQKPLAILEIGVTDNHSLGSKEKWLRDAFNTIVTEKYLHFRAINYWHENWDNDGSLTSLKVDSSPEVLAAFKELIQHERFTSTIRLSSD